MDLDVRKQPGYATPCQVSGQELAQINALAKSELTAEQVYTFAVRLCDNEVDRDYERFDREALEALGRLFVGKTGIFDHNWSAQGQTARLYRTELCRGEGATAAGDPCWYLKGWAYMLRSEKNRELIGEIEAGIKKEVSIGCSIGRRVCSICGEEACSHQKGGRYGGKLCYFTLQAPSDAYEWSFVAVPAQRKAGVIKAFGQEGALRGLLEEQPEALKRLEALEREAELGRAYLAGLRRELVRLAGLAEEELDLDLFARMAEKLEEPELLELARAYRRRAEKRFSLSPQLRPAQAGEREEVGAFLI